MKRVSPTVLKSLSPTGGSFDDITPPMLGESPHPGDTEAKQPTRKGNLWESDLHNLHIFNTLIHGVPMFFNDFMILLYLNIIEHFDIFPATGALAIEGVISETSSSGGNI